MTALAEARAVHAGRADALAVYAGAVKVWPVTPLTPGMESHWGPRTGDTDVLYVVGAPTTGPVRVDVPAYTGLHPTPAAPMTGLYLGSPDGQVAFFQFTITYGQATSGWGRHQVEFQFASPTSITGATVIGALP
jgi:hypothetical protein